MCHKTIGYEPGRAAQLQMGLVQHIENPPPHTDPKVWAETAKELAFLQRRLEATRQPAESEAHVLPKVRPGSETKDVTPALAQARQELRKVEIGLVKLEEINDQDNQRRAAFLHALDREEDAYRATLQEEHREYLVRQANEMARLMQEANR
ncbi:hypothetical protein IWQ60_003095 [Tieghemiomyces parasiticus]|uniref:Uncharacterized protein n=1 Tax=Tieghemiomyces parasiticus TaxID=78921 RepID=A0A9W8E0I4_9FUNG|nr:hypothetical protein IWQ60_003095 [Tieghemiomyces parasiticus]